MGHVRLGVLPKSRKWDEVVRLLDENASVDLIAAAAGDAADSALSRAAHDPGFHKALWLLLQLPIAARGPDFGADLAQLGVNAPADPTLLDLTAAISGAFDQPYDPVAERSDLGEMARLALVESLTGAVSADLPSLFDPEPGDVRRAVGRLSGGDRFAELSRDFFSRLTYRVLDYFLSRELANHIGPGLRFQTSAERGRFEDALTRHCHEAARIVQEYSGGWYGKTVYHSEGLTPDKATRFARYAFKKMRDELGRRRETA